MRVYSEWLHGESMIAETDRKWRSLQWWILCSFASPVARLGYRGLWRHLESLQIRHFWYIHLPHYGLERVTWWHVFGLRKFAAPVPLKIAGIQIEPHCCGHRYRFWWNVA